MTVFLICSALLTLLALSPLLYVLVKPASAVAENDDAAAAKRQALAAARAAGVLTQDEYDQKLAQLKSEAPVRPVLHAPAPARKLALVILVGIPLALFGLYRQYGMPAALSPQTAHSQTAPSTDTPPPTLESAIASLEAKLAENPADPEGWRLLARGQQSMQNFAGALNALTKARELAPDNIDIQVEYAEALALMSSTRRIEGEALTLLENALERDPTQQRALWLLGIAAVQAGDKDTAIRHWRNLQGMLDPESDIGRAVNQQLAELTGEPAPVAAETAPTPSPSPAANNTRGVRVQVSLDPALADKVGPEAVLYVFARPAVGPRMPLAIQRLPVDRLPVDLVLDDSMGPMPTMKLSDAPASIVGARISQTGLANAQSGDLEGLSATISQLELDGPVVIRISQVLP
ncbi:MAG: hypothetical protein IPK97_05390 [Ahniella sp.]|nr:hypothetical protein [Ahniella sp.]